MIRTPAESNTRKAMRKARSVISYFGAFLFLFGLIAFTITFAVALTGATMDVAHIALIYLLGAALSAYLNWKYFVPPFR